MPLASLLSSRPWLRRLLAGLGTLLLLVLLAMWLLPRWVAGSGMQLASQALGRPVSVEAVRLQPWRLALVLQGLRIGGVTPAEPALLEVGEIDGALSLRSLWHRSLVLESLSVQRPVLRLTRLGEGRYDIDDLIQHLSQPSPAPTTETSGPPDFALYNLRLAEGLVLLDDRPYQRRHKLEALQLDLPFLSALDSHVATHVQPRLAGRLNGKIFDLGGDALPFAERREAALELKLQDLDLQPYLAYWPTALPLKPLQGRLQADLRLSFAQAPGKPSELSLGGRLSLLDAVLARGAQADWLAWRELSLELKSLQPLKRELQIDSLRWVGPRLQLQRDAAGRLGLPAFDAPAPGATAAASSKNAPAWRLSLARLSLEDAGLDWQDQRVGAALRLQPLGLEIKQLSWPLQGQAALQLQASLQGGGKAAGPSASLNVQGQLSAEALTLEAGWQDLALAWLSPYLQAELPLALQGRLAGKASLKLAEPLAAQAENRLQAGLQALRLDQLQLQQTGPGGRREPLASLASLSLDEASLALDKRQLQLGQLNLREPRLQLRRAADGRLLLPLPVAPKASEPAAAAVGSPDWSLRLAGLTVEQGGLSLSDASVQPLNRREGEVDDAPYQLVAEQLRLKLQNLAYPASAKDRAALQLSLQLGRPAAASRRFASGARGSSPLGSLQFQGQLGLAPLALSGSLRAERLPLQAADPYLDPQLGLHLRRAEAGFRGELNLSQAAQGLQAQARGDLLLADLRLMQTREREGRREVGEELLSWQALSLAGLRAELAPEKAPRLEVQKAALNDFFARLIVDEQGRFNLRDLGPREAQAQAARAAAQAASAPATVASGPALQFRLGELQLANGNVDFNDRFIRPNYSAKLSELQGTLGSVDSAQAQLAPLALKGKVAGTGLLDISGQLRPGSPPQMDVRAAATDIELAPFSPYAGKYAGYAIERGKLSTQLHYRVDQEGRLQADHQIVLNQLSFGERIDSPDATKLPVLLAVALLKDSQGVIDVNLPVSGSLNDPQFSVGGLILKVIINLLGKALTAPFSLLTGGGGADMSQIAFAPASAQPAADLQTQLDKVAKALSERPALNLTLTGWADPQAEKAALQAAQVDALIQAERRRELRRQQLGSGRGVQAAAGEGAEAPLPPLSEAERLRLLRQVYQASNLPGRPRNLLGLLKDVPPEQMQSLLAAAQVADAEAMRQLALQRAVGLRDALLARGVPNARLFLASPRLHETETGAEAKPWVPRVDMALGLR
ncbi:DUF748 domain-containing protein [Acidovorax soli]|uniref:DUF748 domain-containing protein n=1 Tax=Acidovorax soli TaxID=592050 RepID=UPI0032B2BD42